MTRTTFAGIIVLVEGITDSRFLRRHILASSSAIIICSGKLTVLGAVEILSTLDFGYIAILDRDYDDHKGKLETQPVFYTDTHDVETFLLAVRLETVTNEHADPGKLSDFLRSNSCSIADAILSRAEIFSRYRFLIEVNSVFSIGMAGFGPWKYTDIDTWIVDERRLELDFSTACGCSVHELRRLLQTVPALCNWRDAQGHDSLALLSIGLRKVLGAGKQVSEDSLSSSLRLAFTESDFKASTLYAELKRWEQHSGFLLLCT